MDTKPGIREFFFDLKDISKRIWFIYLMIIVGGLAFTLPSQARDLFQSFIVKKLDIYILGFSAALLIWSIIVWVVCRSTLLLLPPPAHNFDQRSKFDKNILRERPYFKLAKVLPPLLGTMPYLIAALGFYSARLDGHGFTVFCFILIYLILATLTFILIYQKEKSDFQYRSPKGIQLSYYTNRLRKLKFLPDLYRLPYLIGISLSILSLLLFLPWISIFTSVFLGAPTIVVMGLTTVTLILGTLNYLDYRTRYPLIAMAIIFSILFSIINNNHEVRTVPSPLVDKRPDLTEYIESWIKQKSKASKDSASIPLIIVAAEGGGIRSLNWTAGVLKQLSDSIPVFYEHVFALSTVSGGSVGSIFYHTFQSDFSSVERKNLSAEFDTLITADYLSNVTAALMYPELLQVILPFPVPFFDRARYLEDSWAHKYEQTTGKNSMKDNFLSFWKNDSTYTPRLFVNSALTETGQKVVLSSVKLDTTFFPDVIDFHLETGKDVAMKVAASISSRFPYVTPAGTIRNRCEYKSGNLVDGGYYENTGMGTAIQLFNAVTSVVRDSLKSDTELKPVKLMLIFIQNNDYSENEKKNPDFLIDLIAPPKALLNTWGRQSVSVDKTTEILSKKLSYPIAYTKFELANKSEKGEIVLPLGWYISDTARNVSREQISNITNPKKDSSNYYSFQTVKSFLKTAP
ncbi:hypothetical protein OKW21_000244 [Catalinimonas alkaloidigena]|uniref:hypothetical protein n=1 Tax=Catalinimonas alkaloidigena TaxID=1075417 RepID=UPI0024074A9C|nr:hypothetical protein [Catalinimonas alkaloidigena]MDF9794981.1 hypothetical protein [Catalinimonas alkaloidigena]